MITFSDVKWRADVGSEEWIDLSLEGVWLILPELKSIDLQSFATEVLGWIQREFIRLVSTGVIAAKADDLEVLIQVVLPERAFVSTSDCSTPLLALHLAARASGEIGPEMFQVPNVEGDEVRYGSIELRRHPIPPAGKVVFMFINLAWDCPELMDDILFDSEASFIIPRIRIQDFPREFFTLETYAEGLELVAEEIAAHERDFQRCNRGRLLRLGQMGFSLSSIAKLTMLFDWYAVTACNFIKLAGWILHKLGLMSEIDARGYLNSILPVVQTWRDKVAAHPARVTGPRDTEAEKRLSVIKGVSWNGDHFEVGRVGLTVMAPGGQEIKSAIQSWGVTPIHSLLKLRFWSRGRIYIPDHYILTLDGRVVKPPRSPGWPGNRARPKSTYSRG